MKKYLLIFLYFFFTAVLLAQEQPAAGRFLPVPTPAGVGMVDTRVDNMGYWRRMAEEGYVQVEPMRSVEPATFTGSEIRSTYVLTANSPDVAVTESNSTQSENSVFVNPSDNGELLNSNNSTTNPVSGLYGADYLISSDSAATWGGSIAGAGGSNSGDPSTAIGLDGRWYVGFINNQSGQSVAYSTNGGASWTSVVAGIVPAGSGNLLDKNHMWIDNSPTSPYEGNLYNAWTCFGGTNNTEIEITHSTDGGLSWSPQAEISSAAGAGSHNQGVNLQTGPNGEVYAVWAIYDSWPADENALGMAISADGGTSFAPAYRIISNIRGIRNSGTSKNQRTNSFPSMAVDISNSPYSGNIYVVWSNIGVPGDNNGTDRDIYMIRSNDGGTSWDAPIRINQDPAGLGKQHYFPWISCDPVTGDLCVIFYDDRNVSNTQCEVFVAYSYDGGDSWSDFKVSDVAFTPSPISGLASGYMGDYLGISAHGGQVYPIWPDNRTGTVMSYVSPFQLETRPTANFYSANVIPCQGDTITLMDLTNKNPVSWYWSITPASFTFCNGTGANSQNPDVSFDALGDYSVQLIVSNASGADTLLRNAYITVNEVNADFYVDNLQPTVGSAVIFTDASSCNVVSYAWDFGQDATPATAGTAGPHSVSYSSTGLKTVTLTINDTLSITRTDYIDVVPERYFISNTSVASCSGIFYDSQGADANYLNGEHYIMTFNPLDTGTAVSVTFTMFDIEDEQNCGYDWLKIYNGVSTAYPLIGVYCGTNSPGTVTSSQGSLTFEFSSDTYVTDSGWVAMISCGPKLPATICEAGSSVCDEYISNVTLAGIDNTSDCSSNGYHDYTSVVAVLSPGHSEPLSISNGNPDSGDQCGAWIDWNRNSIFDIPDEELSITGTPGLGPYTSSVSIPAGVTPGDCRMRIRITYTGDVSPCGVTTYGEVEDYTVHVGLPGLWIGGTPGQETAWDVATNWDDHRVPLAATVVLVPDNVNYFPQLTGTVQCQDITIEDNASLTVEPGSTLTVTGDLIVGSGNGGTLVINAGTCVVMGSLSTNLGSIIDVKSGGQLIDMN